MHHTSNYHAVTWDPDGANPGVHPGWGPDQTPNLEVDGVDHLDMDPL